MMSKVWLALFWLASLVICGAGCFAVWLIWTLWR